MLRLYALNCDYDALKYDLRIIFNCLFKCKIDYKIFIKLFLYLFNLYSIDDSEFDGNIVYLNSTQSIIIIRAIKI